MTLVSGTEQKPALWVMEIWVDPEWYRLQKPPDSLPTPSEPQLVGVRQGRLTVGRRSPDGVPDIDCGADSGVSRLQAIITSDGKRWFISDPGSVNGTYCAQVDEPLPTRPITGKVQLTEHTRVYVGSWTRLVLRPALEAESAL